MHAGLVYHLSSEFAMQRAKEGEGASKLKIWQTLGILLDEKMAATSNICSKDLLRST